MAWLQLSLPASTDTIDTWSDHLMDAGAVSVSIESEFDDALYELTPDHKPMWQNVKLIALFDAEFDPLIILQQLTGQIDAVALQQAVWSTFADQDWVRKSQDNMQPMFFGNNLWVCPSWSAIPDPNAINIILDPEMAFGTGAHATTALCLEWIAHNIKPGAIVVDYGCGSGILGIAAAKLGAAQIYAVDIDPLALEISLSNAQKNLQSNSAQFITYLPERMPSVIADVVIANILAQPLMSLAPTLAAYLQPGGLLVLSGILEEQMPQLQQQYQSWFTDFQSHSNAQWCRITAVRV